MRLIYGLVLSLFATAALAAASPNNTIILVGSAAVITDASGNTWGIGSGACSATNFAAGSTHPVVINGVVDPWSCSIAEIAYEGGVIWQENTLNAWYSRTSVTASSWSAWTAGTNPIPAVPVYGSSAVLNWIAPTLYTNWTAISVPLTFTVYRGTSATALTKLSSVTGLTYTDPAGSTTPSLYYYAVTATAAGQESAESLVVSDTIQAPAMIPKAPSLTVK